MGDTSKNCLRVAREFGDGDVRNGFFSTEMAYALVDASDVQQEDERQWTSARADFAKLVFEASGQPQDWDAILKQRRTTS